MTPATRAALGLPALTEWQARRVQAQHQALCNRARQRPIGQLGGHRGYALVLAGPQGCGKTTLARKLAAAEGPFREIESRDLQCMFQEWMDEKIKTIIVIGFPVAEESVQIVKAMISNRQMEVNRKLQKTARMPTPNLIFCTGDADALRLDSTDRRFVVVRMGKS